MSILIKGMDMPESLGVTVTIFPDGRVIEYNGYGNYRVCGKAVPVPPHGNLIERERIKYGYFGDLELALKELVERLPIIIPAEEAHNEG